MMPRNICILLDGTGNEFGQKNTNVIKLKQILKEDADEQLVYYSSGLGTILPVGTSTWSNFKVKLARGVDMALARNFADFVCEAYRYLMDCYRPGDKIFLFGFSRGAYVARALAGMIQQVGLLSPGNHSQIRPAYEIYRAQDDALGRWGYDAVLHYRTIFGLSRKVSIEFVGVWDTVSSLGLFTLPRLPFAAGPKFVRYFRQALALDERRVRFTPEYFRTDEEHRRLLRELRLFFGREQTATQSLVVRGVFEENVRTLERDYPRKDAETGNDTAVEVWFMGCHSDVGGGNDVNGARSLSNIPFRWMLREALSCGILLDPLGFALLRAVRLPGRAGDPTDEKFTALLKYVTSREFRASQTARDRLEKHNKARELSEGIASEVLSQIVSRLAEYDAGKLGYTSPDAGSRVHPSLSAGWWPLEMLPLQTRTYAAHGTQIYDTYRQNLGGGRQIIPGQKIHRSVLNRLVFDHSYSARLAKKDRYFRPAAQVAEGMPSWDSIRLGKASTSDIWAE
ncbi:hypothetical protein DB88DRAFT_541500 [Papiliotrema laurentii]|uniref:T6SS Phospholipase effector Tle1-like catalytic domain-containing protein n=1 Tax=Papiliotrema laurentii TaxID=5418 RepID=A0AAD9CX46_PAPLA|nr:hypothetical protein DB88DRAFT_541500 [Papiliotrema laurentii]